MSPVLSPVLSGPPASSDPGRAPTRAGWSLSTKLSLLATLVCVVGVVATSLVTGWRAAEMAREQARQQARLSATATAERVAGDLGRHFAVINGLADTLQGLKTAALAPTRPQLDATARQLLQATPEFIGVYTIWEPNALDGRDAEFASQGPAHDATGRYIAYWNRGAGQIAVEPLLDYEKAGANDWYDIPRRTRQDALIEPYLYPVAGKDVLMTTLVSPILVEGRFVGAAGADLPLKDLSARLGKLEPVPGGRVSLLSNGGLYVATHQPERLAKKAEDLPAEVLSHVAKGESYHFTDAQGWVHEFAPVQVLPGVAPWSVQVSYPQAVAAAAARPLLVAAIGAALLASLLAAAVMVGLVRRLMAPVRVLGDTVSAMARGDADLRVQLAVRHQDELGRISQGFNQFTDKLRQAFREVGDVSGQVALASQEIASGNADLSSRTEQQATHLQHSASMLRELSDGVARSAQTSSHAADLAREAVRCAVNGQQVMQQTGEAMDRISASSRRIAEITALIDSIAFQTNILALNAAVEAARAGDQGRGFAVVAGEVRSLAQRSASAAKDIRGLTQDAQSSVEAGAGLMRQADGVLNGLADSVQRVDQLLSEISSATQQQAARIVEVNSAVGELDQNTQQNAAVVEQAAAAADSLRQQSTRLAETMARFVG